jgi:N utilization substance protein A
MMNKELIYVIEQIGREKGINKEVLFEALESALLSASKKTMGAADNVRMEIDRRNGTLRVFARKKVVTAVTDPKLEITLEEGRRLNGEVQLDDELELELAPQEFGRIAAQTAKQVICSGCATPSATPSTPSSSTARARSFAAPCTGSRSATW